MDTLLDSLFWPGRNRSQDVYLEEGTFRVYATAAYPADEQQPLLSEGGVTPTRTYAPGALMLQFPDGADTITVTSQTASPYGVMTRSAGTPATGPGDLAVTVSFTDNGTGNATAHLAITTSAPDPLYTWLDNGTPVAGLLDYPVVQGQTYALHVRNSRNEQLDTSFTVAVPGGTPAQARQIRQFTDSDRNKVSTTYYQALPDRRLFVQVAPLDAGQQALGGGQPTDGVSAGTELDRVTEGADVVVFTATNTTPFAAFTVQPVVVDPGGGGGGPTPVLGCMDPDATNYNPNATQDDGSCQYAPPVPEPDSQWVCLWASEGIPVDVTPAGPDAPAFVAADLYAGFPEGHPLAADRPLTFVAALRATVGPSGVATFNLAPYLRSEVGALLPSGSRRLDYNSATALTEDLYVGYLLTRGGVTLARGYALNGVLSEQQLSAWPAGRPLTPFGSVLPVWPGYTFASPQRTATEVITVEPSASGQRLVHLPCPRYGLPVVWLSPEGGYGYWVFSGLPVHGDEVGEGQPYTEADTQELRYSSRAASRATVEAYSGVFSERAFVEGLRTLRRSVQAWYQPEADGPWVPIVLKGGAFPAYREGRRRYEATISFTEARPQLVQGQ